MTLTTLQQTLDALRLDRRVAHLAPTPPAEPEPAPAADPNAAWRSWRDPLALIAYGLNGGR